jgi:hypothetical protein
MIATFFIYFRQLIAIKRGVKSQNLLSIIQFLQESQNREARDHVIRKLRTKTYSTWDDDDKRNAGIVCSSYATAGGLLKRRIADPDLIYEGYGPSIKICFETLTPYINDKKEESEPSYWINHEWLYHKVKGNK